MKMHRAVIRLCGSLLFCVLLPVAGSAQTNGAPWVIGERLEVESQVLGETRELYVGLPAGYESGEESYPVLYLLDGPAHFHHTTGSALLLARNDRMPGIIVVGIANTDRTRDLTPPSRNQAEIDGRPTHGGADNFVRFIGDELMPWVEENYRTRPYRILVGHSFGGLFAIHTLTRRPDLFDAYIAISPSLQWSDQDLVSQADAFFEATPDLQADLFMTAGNEGGALLGGVHKLAGVLTQRAPHGFRWSMSVKPEQSHGTVPYLSTYEGLESIFAGWYVPDLRAMYEEHGVAAIDDFYRSSGERFGYDRSTPARVTREIVSGLISLNRLDEARAVLLRDPRSFPPNSALLDGLEAAYVRAGDEVQAGEIRSIGSQR